MSLNIGRRGLRRGLVVLVLVGLAAVGLVMQPMPRQTLPPLGGPAIAEVRTWAYQLQRANPQQIKPDADLLVIDYSADGTDAHAFSSQQVDAFRRRPDGSTRRVLAYLSVGEAESYRYYWAPTWSLASPAWLGPENKEWKHNYQVKFWDRNWQRVVVAPRPSVLQRLVELQMRWRKPYIDRIIEAGFDGVYLDRVDAFEGWAAERPGAERDMVAFVRRISAYAKARRPGFLVVPQNGEELLAHADYRAAIDAVAKEDFLYGLAGDEARNSDDDVSSTLDFLAKARAARLPVLVVEYIRNPDQRFEADARLRQEGFVPLFTTRQLNQPSDAATMPALPVR